jgi:60 kDa SS-A/Ro ribonucleoprotein
MPTGYGKHFSPGKTPQSEKMREDQVPNSAGGFGWEVTPWVRLDRFLVLGTEGGTYYADERTITREAATSVVELIKSDGPKVVARVAEISHAGRAYKNDAALFVLALCFAEGDLVTKAAAAAALNQVARIGTHLFTFVEYVDGMRGWGRNLCGAVAGWYENKTLDKLAYDMTKYRERNGWSHRDVLRLSHQRGVIHNKDTRTALYRYVTHGLDEGQTVESLFHEVEDSGNDADRAVNSAAWAYIDAVEKVKTLTKMADKVSLIKEFNLPREVLPTEWLTEPEVWEALLENMPMTAMIRNLATMTRIGVLKPMGGSTTRVADRLYDREKLKKARIHPIQVLAALRTYSSGTGARGGHSWTPVQAITDALDKAFYLSFDAVEPTNKRIIYALDVSGSMTNGTICGVPGLSPRDGSAALALVCASTEKNYTIVGFTAGTHPSMHSGYKTGISHLNISPRQRLDDAIQVISDLPFGGTDCALPMLWAAEQKIEADAFVILTDSETWHGEVHPAQALQAYRRQFNIPAKLIVVGMVSNGFSIADPKDSRMMDVVGFSTDTPTVISDFIRE